MAPEVKLEYGKALNERQVLQYFRQCKGASEDWFKDIWEENAKMADVYYGETLSDEDKAFLWKTKRPPISFNYARATIDAIIGSDQSDRKEVVFKPFNDEPTAQLAADWQTRLNRNELMRCNVYRHESDALFDMLIGGYGFTETFLDLDVYPVRVPTERVQPWEMLPDPDATEDNLEDARFWIRKRMVTLEEVQARWPDANVSADQASGQAVVDGSVTARIAGAWQALRSKDGPEDRLTLHDFCYKRHMPKVVWIDPATGQRRTTLRREYDKAMGDAKARYEQELELYNGQLQQLASQAMPGMPVDQAAMPPAPQPQQIQVVHEFSGWCFYRAKILSSSKKAGGEELLEHIELEVTAHPYTAITGFKRKRWVEKRIRFFGMAHVIYNPQLYTNRSLQVYMDILARASKGGGFIESDAIEGRLEDFVAGQSTPGWWQVVKPDSIAKIKTKDMPAVPSGIDRFLQLCVDSFSAVSGVTDYVKGTATQERSNVLISNLQTQSMTMLNVLFDPLQRFRVRTGQVRTEIILLHVPDEDINAVIGTVDPTAGAGVVYDDQGNPLDKTGQPMQQGADPATAMTPADVLKSEAPSPFQFNVVVDIGQASPTTKQAVFEVLQQGVGQTILDAMNGAQMNTAPVIFEFLNSMPLPGERARVLSETVRKDYEAQKAMSDQQGVVDAAVGMGPEAAAQIVAGITKQFRGEQQAGQQAGQQLPPS